MAKVLIVGGGVAGLSAGIYAQMNGHEAIICEKHSVAGGNLTGWQRGEYHIDNCIHWLTGTNPNTQTYKMWQELGVLGDVEIMQGESLYTCEYEGKRISLHKDLNKLKKEMLEISPNDKKEILGFIGAVKMLQYMSGIGGESHDKKGGFTFYLKKLPVLLKYHTLSTGQLSNRFTSPLLRQFISCFLGENFASLGLLFVFAHFTGENGGIPRGSSYAMAQRMINKFISLGGKLITGTEVIKIDKLRNTATSALLSNGETVNFDYVIVTADPKTVFGTILNFPIPKQLERNYMDRRLIRFSSYHCAFAVDTDDIDFKGDFIFEISKEYQMKLHTRHLILREFSHERDFAPKGKAIIQTLTFCTEDDAKGFINLKNDSVAYKSLKKEIASIIEKLIIDKFPLLDGKIHCIDVWTPATYKRFVGSEIGSYMSFCMPPKFIPTHAKSRIKGLKNVLLATQWQQVPGGLPIAASRGREAIKELCAIEKQKQARISEQPRAVRI